MVVPKGRGETKAAKKTTTKKATTTKKSKTTKNDSPKSKISDSVLKQRLKKMLEKEYNATSSKSKTSGSSAKKEGLTKSTKKDDGFFKKQDKNKTTTTAKKTATKASASTSRCVDGSCPLDKKTTKAKKATTATKKTTTKAGVSTSKCADGSCPIIKKTTASKKSTASKLAPAGTKRKSVKKSKTVVAKKATVKKQSACGPCGTSCGCSTKSGGRGCGCDSDSDDDSEEDDEDSSFYDYSSDSDHESDSDSSDGGGCGGSGCGPASKRGRANGGHKRKESSSSSWESDSDCPDGKCPYVRRKNGWDSEDIEPPIDNGNDNSASDNIEKSVVPYEQKSQSSSDDDYNLFDDHDSSEDTDDEQDFEYLSSSEHSSSDFSSEYSFSDDSSDDDYQLPEDENEDLYIRRGDAKVYEINDNEQVRFNSDDSSAQIIEIPSKNSVANNKNNDKNEGSDDSCPKLVPIDYTKLNGGGSVPDEADYVWRINEHDSFDDSEDEEKVLPKMKPEIFKTDNSSIENSFDRNFFILQNNFESCESAADVSMDYVSPLERIAGNASTSAKYKIVTANVETCNIVPIADNKSTEKELDQSQSEVLQPIESKFFNSLNSYQAILLLKNQIYFHGTLKVKLVAGAVDIFGYSLHIDETVEIFSPRGNNLMYLKPETGPVEIPTNKLQEKLKALDRDFMTSDIKEILEQYDQQNDAIVLLERNDGDKKIDMIKKYMKENVFPNSTDVNISSHYYRSEVILRCRFHSKCYNGLQVNSKWDSVHVADTTKLMIIGGKSVGKSTFLRYIINKNLEKYKRFLLVDLDIGQPEIFLPQTISATLISQPLLGPGYFYGLTPIKSYLFGDTNVILSPLSYIANVKELLKYCQQDEFKGLPWIINTLGYNKGFGSELLSVIIGHLQPSDVVQLQSRKQYNNFDFAMSPENVRSIARNIYITEDRPDEFEYNLFVIESAVSAKKIKNSDGKWEMSPKDIRFSMIISVLGSLMSERDEWLTDVKPYSVSIDDLNIICFGEENITKADLLEVVNGNMVYMCNNSSATIECYGIGIVRGVDKFQQKLYIVTSTVPQHLINVNAIAVCNIPLPASILLNQGPKIKGLVPYTYNTKNLISSKYVPQHIYRPQHFLKASRQNLLNN